MCISLVLCCAQNMQLTDSQVSTPATTVSSTHSISVYLQLVTCTGFLSLPEILRLDCVSRELRRMVGSSTAWPLHVHGIRLHPASYAAAARRLLRLPLAQKQLHVVIREAQLQDML